MKKIAIICASALITLGAQAQTQKGNVALTGRFGYTQQKADPDKSNGKYSYTLDSYTYTLAPAIGVFVKDNLEIGASVYLTKSTSESLSTNLNYRGDDLEEGEGRRYSVYATQYKFLKERLAMHGTLSAGLGNTENSRFFTNRDQVGVYQLGDHYDRSSEFSVALSPGLTFFPSDRIGVSANLGSLRYSRRDIGQTYKSVMYNNDPEYIEAAYISNILELNFSTMYLNFGLTYFFGK
ncbi:hypothetical protein [uncultured Pontibacter sp.]|uniref:hypothetical protein n=1 Tax=uncultured Pontibacter sp. TaxID=453356 RepID=UPI0026162028|nr:hypothetical protein [uncultured Pontibacter sp.]